jgi:hypothetical protein
VLNLCSVLLIIAFIIFFSISKERTFLRVAQIADPHVGVHMSAERLHGIFDGAGAA